MKWALQRACGLPMYAALSRQTGGALLHRAFGAGLWYGGHFQISERAELDPYDVVASPRVVMSSGDECVNV